MNQLKKITGTLSAICVVSVLAVGHAWSGGAAGAKSNNELQLTQAEKAWLAEHPSLRVSTSPGWAPISFLDNSGKFRGIAVDYLTMLERMLGIKFVYVHADDSRVIRDADIISAISNPKVNTPEGFVALSQPYISSPLAIYARESASGIHSLEDLHWKKVAVFQSRIAAQHLNRDHPQIKLVKTDIADEALAAVTSGKVDAYVGSLVVVSYVIREQGMSSVKIVGQTPYRSELHMAVRSDSPELQSIMQKALNALKEEDRNTISRKWTAVTYEHETDYQLILTIVSVAAVLIVLISLWTWRLNKEVQRRKRAEAEIERARGMLQLVLDTVPIGVLWLGRDKKFLGCNKFLAAICGLENPVEIVGRGYRDLPESLFSEDHFARNESVLSNGEPLLGIGEQVSRSNGSIMWVRTNRVPLHDGDGEVVGLLITLEDVSAFRDSQIRNVAITEATLECLITIDMDGRIVDFNPAAENTFGYSKAEALGESMGDLIVPPMHRVSHVKGMEHYRKTGEGPVLRKRIEITAMRKGGEEFPIELAIVPFEESGQTYFLGSMRDISERKTMEAEQQRVNALLQETVNNLAARQLAMDEHASVTISDLQGNILYANQKFCEISQYSQEELLGRSHSMLKSGLHDRAFYQDMWQTITAGKVWHGEIANRKKDGDIYWLVATISPVLGEDGKPVQYISVRTDISTQRKTEYELDMARARELAIGNQIQRTLLFGQVPGRIGNASIDLHTEPSMGIDGDFYEFFSHSPQLFDIAIGDVMGKGIPAALIGAAVKQQLNRVMTEQLSAHVRDDLLPDPETVINSLHANISPQLIDLERFVTLAYARCDLGRREITMVDAGHTRAILSRPEGISFVSGDNLPLGVLKDERYQQRKIPFSEGDMLFLYSDGITEAQSPEGEYFGEERLSLLVREMHLANIPAPILGQVVRYHVNNFEQNLVPSDDRTLAALHFDQIVAGGGRCFSLDLPWQLDALHQLRDAMEKAAHKVGMSDADTGAFILAGFEAATNVLRHAPMPLSDAILHCRIEESETSLTLSMYHVGDPYQPETRMPDFSGDSEGGFGLYIIRNSVDEFVTDAPARGVCRTLLRKNKTGMQLH